MKRKKKEKGSVSGTKEWAASTVNIQNGCANNCKYCWARAFAARFKRKAPDDWKHPEIRPHDVDKEYKKRDGTILFPSTHDITIQNIRECVVVLRKLLEAGNRVLIVSKPDPDCIMALCAELYEFKDQILFRFTIGSADDTVLEFWEPNAPSFEDRILALQVARDHDFETSVSSEPMLDNHIEAVVEQVLPYVTDAIWIGLPNRLKGILSVCGEGEEMMARAEELMAGFTEDRIMELYETYRDNPQIKWKESIKKIVGIEVPTEAGLDI